MVRVNKASPGQDASAKKGARRSGPGREIGKNAKSDRQALENLQALQNQHGAKADVVEGSEPTGTLGKMISESEKNIQDSSLFKSLESISEASHYMTQGHTDAVTCLCADLGAECIVTGSKDGTMRVWNWDGHTAATFVLKAVIQHGTTVTTVSCLEARIVAGNHLLALVASGTDKGDIFYIDISSKHIQVKKGFHRGAVHDLSIKHAGIETCSIILDTTHTKLGVGHVWQHRGLQVNTIMEGALKDWNSAHPSLAVQPNNVITKWNGSDLNKLNEANCNALINGDMSKKKKTKSHLELWRCQDDEHFVASGGDSFAKVVKLTGDKFPYSLTVVCELEHGCKVSRVKFLDSVHAVKPDTWGFVEPRLLTSSVDGTRIWGVRTSSLLLKLETAGQIGGPSHVHGACIPDNNQSMLFSVFDDLVSVWNLEKAEKRHASGHLPEPERQYSIAAQNFDSFSGSQRIASSLAGNWIISAVGQKCTRWRLDPPAKCSDCGSWRSDLESQLLENHVGTPIQEMDHQGIVTALHVFEDPDDGDVLVCGCSDGQVIVWDVSGDDSGEVIAGLRSLSLTEFYRPMILMLVSFVQLSTFAFGPAVPWLKQEHTLEHTHDQSSTWLKFLVPLIRFNPALMFNEDRVDLFYASTWSMLWVMILFVAVIVSDYHLKLTNKMILLNDSIAQMKNTSKKEKQMKRQEMMTGLIRFLLNLLGLLIWACCSVLVVPMSNSMIQAVSCRPDDAAPGHFVLIIAPEVHCFTGRHWDLVAVIAVVAPVFFFLLFPYAVVRGDSNYVQRSELLSIEMWNNNAIRKATIFHLGPLHPRARHVFVDVCAEVIVKMALPVTVKVIHAPLLQMQVVTTISIVLFVVTVNWKPMIEDTWNGILIGMRLWTVCAMLCACMAVLLNDPGCLEPMCALGACTVSVFVGTLAYVIKSEKAHQHEHTVRLNIDDAFRVKEIPGGRVKQDSRIAG